MKTKGIQYKQTSFIKTAEKTLLDAKHKKRKKNNVKKQKQQQQKPNTVK